MKPDTIVKLRDAVNENMRMNYESFASTGGDN
jgi:hypothetical protein